jgi:hypothetical protein
VAAEELSESRQRDSKMEIKRSGSQPSSKVPTDWFTGTVRIAPLFQAPDPAGVACASVTFEPAARAAWHTHPLVQTLIVTSGLGWAQRCGGPVGRLSRLLHASDTYAQAAPTSRFARDTRVRRRVPFPLKCRNSGRAMLSGLRPVEYWTVTMGSDDQPGINGGMLRPREGQSPGTMNTVAVESLRAGLAVNEALDKIQEQGGCVPVTSFHRRKAW